MLKKKNKILGKVVGGVSSAINTVVKGVGTVSIAGATGVGTKIGSKMAAEKIIEMVGPEKRTTRFLKKTVYVSRDTGKKIRGYAKVADKIGAYVETGSTVAGCVGGVAALATIHNNNKAAATVFSMPHCDMSREDLRQRMADDE